MKNISPISPSNEIVPEENTPQTSIAPVPQPAQPSQEPDPPIPPQQPPATQTETSIPAQAPEAPQPFYQSTSSLYPSPLSPEERRTLHEETRNLPKFSDRTAISQYGIPLVVGIYALSELWRFIKAFSGASTVNALGGFTNFLNSYLWAVIIIGLLQSALMVYGAYKVYQGSLAGLAFVSGISLIIVPQILAVYILSPGFISIAFGNFQTGMQLIGYIGITVMVILAWTKERSAYYK